MTFAIDITDGPEREIPPPPSDDINNLKVVADIGLAGDVVSFSMVTVINVGTVQLYRGLTADINGAAFVATMQRQLSPQSYHDTAAGLAGKVWFYFIVLFNSDLSANDVYGPVSVSLVTPVAPPVNSVAWMDASHDDVSGGSVETHITSALDPSVTDFSSMRIYINGYRAVIVDKLIAQHTRLDFSFLLAQTGETVTLKAVIVNSGGSQQTIGTAATKQITLGAVKTVPAKLAKLLATEGKDGTQVAFDSGNEASIDGYRLYRSARGAAFSTAILVQQGVETNNPRQTMFDAGHKGASFQWFVTSFNSKGESAASDAVWPSLTY